MKTISIFVLTYINIILFICLMFIHIKPAEIKRDNIRQEESEVEKIYDIICPNIIDTPVVIRYASDVYYNENVYNYNNKDTGLEELYAAVEIDLLEDQKRLQK